LTRGYNVVSGGTQDHLFLLDLIDKGITGKDAEAALHKANITVNKNAVPNDPQSPFVTSGLRIGTPAITTRGYGVQEAKDVAGWMCDIMENMEDAGLASQIKDKVLALNKRYPVYG